MHRLLGYSLNGSWCYFEEVRSLPRWKGFLPVLEPQPIRDFPRIEMDSTSHAEARKLACITSFARMH
jgi:hypothetical protein